MAEHDSARWADDGFLDGLRLQGDAAADACLAELAQQENFSGLFAFLNANDTPIPDDAPAALRTFFEAQRRPLMPDGEPVDEGRLERGGAVFATHALCSALVLLLKSLPAGYAAPNLGRLLVMSGNLQHHPYTRLLGVLQMMVNVTSSGGFDSEGKALITAAKLRLLHAGVRHIARKRLAEYEAEYGTPVNHEDMLATIMGFSLLVVRGLRQLDAPLTDEQAEDYYYIWRMYALAMGIHPEGAPNSSAYLPLNLAEAEIFYDAYARRHYRDAAENPEGVELTRANLLMVQHLVDHTPLRWFPTGLVPRAYLELLLGSSGAKRRGVEGIRGHRLALRCLRLLPPVISVVGRWVDRSGYSLVHAKLGELCFEGLIVFTMRGEVTFLVPEHLTDLYRLTEPIVRPHGERRRRERRQRRAPALVEERRAGLDRRLAFRQTFWGLDQPAPATRET